MRGDEIFLTCSTSPRTFILYAITFLPGGRIRLYVILGFHPRCALSRGYGGESPRYPRCLGNRAQQHAHKERR